MIFLIIKLGQLNNKSMIFMTDCSLKIGGARLMHGPFTKLLEGAPLKIDASVSPSVTLDLRTLCSSVYHTGSGHPPLS